MYVLFIKCPKQPSTLGGNYTAALITRGTSAGMLGKNVNNPTAVIYK